MKQVILTLDDNVSDKFVRDFLKRINFIKNITISKAKKTDKQQTDEISLLSEKALADEWLSKEDNRWDNIL